MAQMKGAVLALALAGAAMSGTAEARTIYGAKYTGVVQSGYDLTGLFGTANSNLAGDSFTEVFTINTAASPPIQTPTYELELGGSEYGMAPSVSASITINGITQSITGLYAGMARTGYDSADGLYEIMDSATDSSTTSAGAMDNFISGGIQTTDAGLVPTSFGSYHIVPNGGSITSYNSDFQFQTQAPGSANYRTDTFGVLTVTSATPEPSTWLLMLAGVGGIGYAFRQAKRRHGFRFRDAFAA